MGLNGMLCCRHPFAVKRIARDVSHKWIGADSSAAMVLCELLGHEAAPTFFWGGKAARA
jgi:hypothetical protein